MAAYGLVLTRQQLRVLRNAVLDALERLGAVSPDVPGAVGREYEREVMAEVEHRIGKLLDYIETDIPFFEGDRS